MMRYNESTDLLPAPKRLPAERLALRLAKRGHPLPSGRHIASVRTFIPATGRDPIPVQWAPDPCMDSLPDPTTRVGFIETKNHNVKLLRQLQRGSMICTGLCQERVQAAVPFYKGFDVSRISHRHRVSAGTPCIANTSRRT